MSEPQAQTPTAVTSEHKKSTIIQKQATPYLIEVTIPKEQIQGELDTAWQQVKGAIPLKEWAGFQHGSDAIRAHYEQKHGLTGTYRAVWLKILRDAAGEQERFILDVVEISAAQKGEDYCVAALLYFVPSVDFAHGLEMDQIPAEVYSLHPTLIENGVKQKTQELLKRQAKYAPIDASVQLGMSVKVNIQALLEGKPWAAGTTKETTMHVAKNEIFPEELFEAIQGKKRGDEFQVECPKLPNIYGPDAGKKFEAQVQVVEVFSKIDEPEEEMFKRAGFESKEKALETFTEQSKSVLLKNRESAKYQKALHYLRKNSSMEPIPIGWLKGRAEADYEALLKKHPKKSERDVLAQYGAPNKTAVIQSLIPQVADLLRDEATILSYAKQYGKLDFTLPIEQNFSMSQEFIKERIQIKEVDPISVRTKQAALAQTAKEMTQVQG